ncbi:MAG: trypsin-like peptidase domain-containing protein [Dehalococcoidia bacterium]|nr:trypsin-like peptidase domain-containing protein [Dehalococcoidia bacterium]
MKMTNLVALIKPRGNWSITRAFIVVTMLALLVAVACNNDTDPTTEPTGTTTPATAIPAAIDGTESGGIPMLQFPNIADTVERVRPAVVSIVSQSLVQDRFGRVQSSFGSGTGVIFDESGLVLTNNHVIENGVQIIVTQDDGTQVEAEIIGADRISDLAVLQLPGDGYPSLPLRENGSLRAGDWVIAIGNALALPGGPTVTVGVVSALGRSIEASPGITLYELIQTDTSINPGNSGGPLIDLNGNLIGINTAVLRGSSGVAVEGIGFAINIETAQQVAEQLVELGHVRWAWMGVYLADLIPEVAAEVGLPIREGVIIRDTVLDGPSHQAGMIPGDILVNIAGHDIATISDLTRLLKQEFSAGQSVEVEVYRVTDGVGDRTMLNLELGERPRQ